MSDVTAAAPEITSSAPPSLDDIAAGFEAELNAEDGAGTEPQPQQAKPTPDPEPRGVLEDDSDGDDYEFEASDNAEPDSEADDDSLSDPDADTATSEPTFLPGMSEEERQTFAKLPAELQSWVSTREASRQADYTRKTQAIAEQTKELDESITETLQRINQYDTLLAEFEEVKLEPPPAHLEQEDPLLFDELKQKFLEANYHRNIAQQERQKIAQEREVLATHAHKKWVAEQVNELIKAEPIFGDETRGPQLREELQNYALKQGFEQQHLRNLSAKEAIILLKAKRYDDAIERKKTAPKAVKAVAPKTATPGVSRVGRPTRAAAAVRDFDSNPNAGRDDLARLFEAELAAEQR